jgi:quinol monooxygenase YgiN
MKRLNSLSISALLALLAGCSVSTPFRWLDETPAGLAATPDAQVIVAVTHATIDASRRKIFDQGAQRVIDSLLTQPGLIGYSVRRQLFGNEVWTATVWTDEASLLQFVQSPAHLQAVREGNIAIMQIDYTQIRLRKSELPVSWSRLLSESNKTRGGNG